jgi:hypothetical protein
MRPTPLSDTYRVRVVYGLCEPRAYVESPQLQPREAGGGIPHTYRDPSGPRPCLYVPGSGEWTNEKLLASTIVPWLMEWLLYYELWHATDEWLGGGIHPQAVAAPDGEKSSSPAPHAEMVSA